MEDRTATIDYSFWAKEYGDDPMEVGMKTRWHEAIDTMVTIDRAIEWNDSEEKYLYVEYNVLDLVNEKAPMDKLDAVEYVEDRFQELLDAREEWYRLRLNE